MTFGRTPLIPKAIADQVPYPSPTGSPDDDTFRGLPPDQPPTPGFFNAFCKLHRILGDILESFYTESEYDATSLKPNTTLLSGQKMEKVIQIEQSLAQWSKDLSPNLQRSSSRGGRPRPHYNTRQINVLHARCVCGSCTRA